MTEKILALCDTEEDYALLMAEFLRGQKDLPYKIITCTNPVHLLECSKNQVIDLLVVAENAYTEEVRKLPAGNIILLNESGMLKWEEIKNVSKYQQAEVLYKVILDTFIDMTEVNYSKLGSGGELRIIGMYSPVRRCLQTTFALTLGQMLAQNSRTLYLNFEHYAGITELLPDIQTRDLADLLYFLTAKQDKFLLRLRTIVQKKGEMDYIPPMKTGRNLLGISAADWMELLNHIIQMDEYEYVILDLSESIQGLFQILRRCHKVFTLTKDDHFARSKMIQYEQLLALDDYEDVMEKTRKYNLPLFRRLPENLEQYTKGDLADYIRNVIEKELS